MKLLIGLVLVMELAAVITALIKPREWWDWKLVRWFLIHVWLMRQSWNLVVAAGSWAGSLAGPVLARTRIAVRPSPRDDLATFPSQVTNSLECNKSFMEASSNGVGGGAELDKARKDWVVGRGETPMARVVVAAIAIVAVVVLAWTRLAPVVPPRALRIGAATAVVLALAVGAVVVQALTARGPGRDGFARPAELRRHLSERAVRRSGRVTRSRLGGKPADVNEYGILLGTGPGRRRLYAAHRDVVLAIAPPQTGKTAWMGGRVIDAPGAVVATSTKTDLYHHTVALRAQGARSVWVFNPEGLGDVPNTLRWSPLEGCDNPMTAQERAGYLIGGASVGGGTTDASFWEQSTVRVLRNLLFAAAITERSMRDVAMWVNNPDDRTALRILENEPVTPLGWAWDLRQIMDTPAERTKESVFLTLSMALQFMTDPSAAAAVCPLPGDRVFTMRRFLMEGSTLYLIGSDRQHSSISPLFACLTGYLFEEAKRMAQNQPGGRLDPPLTMALDEAALICRVPLDRWTADSGGRGIPLLIAVQSPSQLYDAWGERGGQTIVNNSNATMVFGGLGVARDLEDFSRLCGEREEKVSTYSAGNRGDRSRSVTTRKVPVMAPHQVRQLRDRQALLLYRSLPPVVIKTEAVWERRDVRRLKRQPAAAIVKQRTGAAARAVFTRTRAATATSSATIAAAGETRPGTGGEATTVVRIPARSHGVSTSDKTVEAGE